MKKTLFLPVICFLAFMITSCTWIPENTNENSGSPSSSGLNEFTIPVSEFPAFTDKPFFGSVSLSSSNGMAESQKGEKSNSELRGIWFSYLDYAEFLQNKTKSEYTDELKRIFSEMKDFGLNCVIFQVRPHADSIYQSEFFPVSAVVSGSFNQSLSFDPLEIAVKEAHAAGLEFHAWFNLLRGHTETEAEAVPETMQFGKWFNDNGKKGDYIVYNDAQKRWFYNPGCAEVRTFLVQGAVEIAAKYPVDGIHIDDYFYPTTDESFDAAAYARYLSGGGQLELSDYRRENINSLLREIYKSLKDQNPDVLFGVSPGGNISQAYSALYADVALWCKEPGYLDYVVPQIYYSFQQTYLPFTEALSQWASLPLHSGARLFVGLAAYKAAGKNPAYLTEEERADWAGNNNMLARQLNLLREKNAGGFVLFAYRDLFSAQNAALEGIAAEKNELRQIIE